MSAEIKTPEGTEYDTFNISNPFGLSDEQIDAFGEAAMQKVLDDYNNAIFSMAERASRIGALVEESQRNTLQQQAEAYAEAYVKASHYSPVLLDAVLSALSSLSGNRHYNSSTNEDTMNDYVRDVLRAALQVRDQTRQGISSNSRTADKGQAGEVDIQIRNNGYPIGIYEGLRLDSVDKKYIHEHIAKATVNYNPQGVKNVFVVAYVIKHSTGFGKFWERFSECVREYTAENEEHLILWDEKEENTGMSAIRVIHGTFDLDDAEHNVYVIAVKIME